MLRQFRRLSAIACLALWAAFTILWWRSIGREDHVSICVPLGRIESPRPGADLLPSAAPLVNPEMSVDPPDPRDAKRRCLLLSLNSMAGKLGIAGAAGVIPADGAEFDWHLASVSPPDMDPWFAYKKSLLGFAYVPNGTREFGVAAPFWFLVSASGIATALLWGGRLLHFTTRGALIATTLLAWVLGLGVILSR
jgi:hypothetical protein